MGSYPAKLRSRAHQLGLTFIVTGLVALSHTASGVAATETPEGSLAPLPGSAGCVAETGLSGKCGVGIGLDVLLDVVVSPDGKNVYAFGRETIGAYARHADGSLTQINCVSETGTFGKCSDGYGLFGGENNYGLSGQLIISGDGRHLYAFNPVSDRILAFERQGDGSVRQLSAPAGCVADGDFGGECIAYPLINAAADLELSPDGRHLYVAGSFANAVLIFQRDPETGLLSQSAVVAHRCVSPTQPNCKPVSNAVIERPIALAISPDGNHVYVGSDGQDPTARDVVASFGRDATTGELTPIGGPTGCMSASGSGGQCIASPLGNAVGDVVVAPDGRNLYVTRVGRIEVDPQTGQMGRAVVGLEGEVYGQGGSASSFTSDGRFVYSLGRGYAVSATGDLLSVLGDEPFPAEPIPVGPGTTAVSPDDRNVYLTSTAYGYGESALHVYNRTPAPMAFGKLKRRKNGSALLTVTVPESGTLTLAKTKQVKGKNVAAQAAGPQQVRAKIAPSARAKRKLARSGRAKVSLRLTFQVPTGQATESTKRVKLVRRAG
jgi:DNA-binding beta-propeller fold protein YncE